MGNQSINKLRRVVFQPSVYSCLQSGIDQMVDAVRPTYGPLHGTVMMERVDKLRLPEVLDDGGLISRRIVELADRDEDVGAMMVRHLMWRMHERFGDATVTAALIYQSVFAQGVKFVVHGGNAMLLRRHLEKGAQLVFDALGKQAQPVSGPEQLIHLAETLCRDADLARNLGETLIKVGRYGQLDIRAGRGRSDLVEYINGMTWKGEFFSRSMVWDTLAYRSELEDTAVLVSNMIVDNPYELAEWLERLIRAGVKQLFLLAGRCARSVSMSSTRPTARRVRFGCWRSNCGRRWSAGNGKISPC